MKEKTGKVKFSEKHPVISLLLYTFGAYILAQYVFGMGLYVPVSKITGLDTTGTMGIGATIGSLIVLVIWHKRCSPEYRFLPQKGDIAEAVKLITPILLYWVILFGIYAVLAGGWPFGLISVSTLMACFMAGFSEEIVFREVSISYMTKIWRSEKMIPVIAGLSGLMFGLTHMTNLVSGWKITDILYQVLLSTIFGYFFAAVYLRTGCIWVLCIAHTLHDILSFSGAQGLSNAGISTLPDWVAVMIFIIEAGLGIYGYFLVRKSKRKEIIEFWDHKWSREA